MMRALTLALAGLLAACSAAPVVTAQDPAPSCRQWEPIRQTAPASVHLTEITPAAPFLAALNKLPPETDLAAERVWVARRGADTARIFLVTGGCLVGGVDIPLSDLAKLLGAES